MAPLLPLLALFAFALSNPVLASPHAPRNAYNHAHRAIANPLPIRAELPLPLPHRKRSLNKRCIPNPSNATSSAPSSAPSSPTVPINVEPLPLANYSSYSSSTSSSSSSTPTPTPTPTPSTSTPAIQPAQTASSYSDTSLPSFMTGTQTGQGTYYSTGLGACGITNNDGQRIAAVSKLLFDSYPGFGGLDPNTNPVCGKSITAHCGGKSTTVTITDRCEACAITDLDFSPTAFDDLADPSLGRVGITWTCRIPALVVDLPDKGACVTVTPACKSCATAWIP